MATRIKTIEFASQTIITTLAAATNRDLTGSTNLFIPETGGTFAFKSVILQVQCSDDNAATAATLTNPVIAISLGGAFNSATGANPVVNSGEEQEWTFTRDITSYMNTTWSGISNPWYVRVNYTGLATANHSAKILITYQYDDTISTTSQIKTIRIPIESTRTLLTTTYQTIGGATAIPAFKAPTSYLPETGITIRQIFVELWGNTGMASTGTFTWTSRFGGSTTINTYRAGTTTKNSAQWVKGICDITGLALTSATSLEGIVSTTTNRMCTVGGQIVVTYEFDTTTSTVIYNSLLLGAVDTSGWIGGTTAADQGVWERQIYIEEPNTITLKESGLCLYQNDSAGYTFNVAVSGDTTAQTTVQAYVNTAGTLQAGTYSMVHRIDAGGQKGQAGISLKRGKNLYRVQFYSGTAQAGWNLSGYLILNYTSGKHPNGVGVHAHSVYQHVADNITAGGSRITTSTAVSPTIPESQYYLLGFLFWVNYSPLGNGATSTLDMNITVQAEVHSGETFLQGGNGWVNIYNGSTRSDSENQNGYIYAAARTNFTRWEGDPDQDRMNLRNPRKYRLDTGPLFTGSMGYWYTYNNINYTISGTCTGYSGDGSGIDIDVFRIVATDKYEQILDLKTVAGGTFSGTWVDNTDTLFVSARQDDTHVGRSMNGQAT